MYELLVGIRSEEIEKNKKDEIEKKRNEKLVQIMKGNLDFLVNNENHKKNE